MTTINDIPTNMHIASIPFKEIFTGIGRQLTVQFVAAKQTQQFVCIA